MRNLSLFYHSFVCNEDLGNILFASIDYDSGNICLLDECDNIAIVCHSTGQIINTAALKNKLKDCDAGNVISIHCLCDQHSVVVFTDKGNILSWDVASDMDIEEVGKVNFGLKAVSWSPDEEILVLATDDESLILMTREFEYIKDVSIPSEENLKDQFVKVGWGKRETQFQGSAGKAAAFTKVEPVQPITARDDKRTRISWRGDGQMFVVSSINTNTGARQLSIWERSFNLLYISENVNGLEHVLSWRPSGNLITTVQRSADSLSVIFFEKNGLRHGEFALPLLESDLHIKEVLWNMDSSILAIWSISSDIHIILLYTSSNYHWYLKQSLRFPSVSVLMWHPEHLRTLIVIDDNCKISNYTWTMTTARSNCTLAMSSTTSEVVRGRSSVAVIDGDSVLMTPFRSTIIPPPFCAYKVKLSSQISQVTFSSPDMNDVFACLTNDGELSIFTFDGVGATGDNCDHHIELVSVGGQDFAVKCDIPRFHCSLDVQDLLHSLRGSQCTSHMTWLNESSIVLFTASDDGGHSVLNHLSVGLENKPSVVVRNTCFINGLVCATCVNWSSNYLVIHTTNGKFFTYNSENVSIWDTMFVPQPCYFIDVCSIGSEDTVIGLSENYRLYLGSKEIASNCTSFIIHNHFLLFTTLSHTCRCINLTSGRLGHSKLEDNSIDEDVRSIERGARIVTSVAGDTKLILQMPRGNIETINPKSLVINHLQKLLDNKQFREAFIVMKRHRINLNLLHDHDSEIFFTNLDHVIGQLDSTININLFLMSLSNDDVTETIYRSFYASRKLYRSSILVEMKVDKICTAVCTVKVDKICTAVRTVLATINPEKYVLSIITSHIRESSPNLEAALRLIQHLPETCVGGIGQLDALTYTLYLVDVNDLLDAALGMYDFRLVVLVAERSHKDPKEYLSFISELQKMDERYQKFSIDKYLKRHQKALKHLINCEGRFNECCLFVKEHKLYRLALTLFSHDSDQYKVIADDYGSYLLETKNYEESGIYYHKAHKYESAFKSFQLSGNWQQCVGLLRVLDPVKYNKIKTFMSLAQNMKDQRRYNEAAILFEIYLNDYESAVESLIEGSLWEEALRLIYKYDRADLIETHLTPQLRESCSQLYSSLTLSMENFTTYKQRLSEVRRLKSIQSELYDVDGRERDGPNTELYSDTQSVTSDSVMSTSSDISSSSRSSTASRKSSRKKRKKHQKRWSLKEGSPHEDFALIEALSKLIITVDGMTENIRGLLLMLIRFNMETDAGTLQKQLMDSLDVIQASLPEIWPTNTVVSASDSRNNESSLNNSEESTAIPIPVVSLSKREWMLTSLNFNN